MMAKRTQPNGWVPSRPGTRFASALRRCIASMLANGSVDVRIFVSTGTPLDFYYGVDMFVEYHGRIVTIDLTMRKRKENFKAQVLVTRDDIVHDRLQNIARQIVIKLGGTN